MIDINDVKIIEEYANTNEENAETKKAAIRLAIELIQEFGNQGLTSIIDWDDSDNSVKGLCLQDGPIIGYQWRWSKALQEKLFPEET